MRQGTYAVGDGLIPSIVVMVWPAQASTGRRHAFATVYSIAPGAFPGVAIPTVHAPHPPSPHPILVPVRPGVRACGRAGVGPCGVSVLGEDAPTPMVER